MRNASYKDLELSVKLNGFEAQKCNFPFTYKAKLYESCTNADLNFDWCSPTSEYTNQTLKCEISTTMPNVPCPGESLDSNVCGYSNESSWYHMRFTTCPSHPATIKAVSTEFAYFDTVIIIFNVNAIVNI